MTDGTASPHRPAGHWREKTWVWVLVGTGLGVLYLLTAGFVSALLALALLLLVLMWWAFLSKAAGVKPAQEGARHRWQWAVMIVGAMVTAALLPPSLLLFVLAPLFVAVSLISGAVGAVRVARAGWPEIGGERIKLILRFVAGGLVLIMIIGIIWARGPYAPRPQEEQVTGRAIVPGFLTNEPVDRGPMGNDIVLAVPEERLDALWRITGTRPPVDEFDYRGLRFSVARSDVLSLKGFISDIEDGIFVFESLESGRHLICLGTNAALREDAIAIRGCGPVDVGVPGRITLEWSGGLVSVRAS